MDDLYKELKNLRSSIDSVDQKIVKLLNERVHYALKISEIKNQIGLPVYDEVREKKVLQLIEKENTRMIPLQVIHSIFSLIIKETRELEEKKKNETKN